MGVIGNGQKETAYSGGEQRQMEKNAVDRGGEQDRMESAMVSVQQIAAAQKSSEQRSKYRKYHIF